MYGVPEDFQSLGRAEHTRVLTTKTAFWYTYKGSARDSGGKEKIIFSLFFCFLSSLFAFLCCYLSAGLRIVWCSLLSRPLCSLPPPHKPTIQLTPQYPRLFIHATSPTLLFYALFSLSIALKSSLWLSALSCAFLAVYIDFINVRNLLAV